jgi:surface antigen
LNVSISATRTITSSAAVCALVLTVAPAALVAAAPDASASARTVTVHTESFDLNVRSAPSVTSQKIGSIPTETKVVIVCFTKGEPFTGGPYQLTTNIWNQLESGGFVTDAMLNTGSNEPVVPPCVSETPTHPVASTAPAPARLPAVAGPAMGKVQKVNNAVSGECTWGAYEKWFQASGNQFYPALTGEAKDWANSARAAGWTVTNDPHPRSIVVFQPGVAGAPSRGHVGWVDSASQRPDGTYIHVTDMNLTDKKPMTWTARTLENGPGMSYILLP